MHEEQTSMQSEHSNVAESYASLHSQSRMSRASDQMRPSSHDNMRSTVSLMNNEDQASSVSLITKKIISGLFISVLVCTFWIIYLQCIKNTYSLHSKMTNSNTTYSVVLNMTDNTTETIVTTTTTFETNASTTETPITKFHSADIPFFFTYITVSSMALFYPLYLLLCCCCLGPNRQQLNDIHRINMIGIEGDIGKKYVIALRCGLFTALWLVMTYCCHQALRKIKPMEMAVIFTVQPSFSYILSWVVLQKKFLGIRIIAFIMGASGVILNIYSDQDIMWYKVLAALSGAFYAIFNIIIDRLLILYIPHVIGQMLLILSAVGVCTLLSMWPLVLILTLVTKTETGLDSEAPWFLILSVVVAYIMLMVILRTGKYLTYDFLLNFGFLLALIVDGVIEVFYLKTISLIELGIESHDYHDIMRLAGICLIIVGYFLAYVPQGWHRYLGKLCHIMPQNDSTKIVTSKRARQNRM